MDEREREDAGQAGQGLRIGYAARFREELLPYVLAIAGSSTITYGWIMHLEELGRMFGPQ